MEVICGSCGGRCKVNSYGITVACPHCGDHLFVSEEAAQNAAGPVVVSPVNETSAEQETDALQEATVLPGSMSATPAPTSGDADTQAEFVLDKPPEMITEFPELDFTKSQESPKRIEDQQADQPLLEEKSLVQQSVEETETSAAQAEIPSENSTAAIATDVPVVESAENPTDPENTPNTDDTTDTKDLENNESVAGESPALLEMPDESPEEHSFDFNFSNTKSAESASEPAAEVAPVAVETKSTAAASLTEKPAERSKEQVSAAPPAGKTVSWLLFVLVLSYASAMTIAVIYLLTTNRTHQLESLPDVKLPGKAFRVIPEGASLPPEHDLKIGGSRRFGNIQVTVRKITREYLELDHYSGDSRKNFQSGERVVKLWLKLKNVSSNQVFSPIDEMLLLGRATDPKTNQIRANNFVCKTSQKKKSGKLVYVFDLPEASGFQFAEMSDFEPLQPGEEMEIYIPTTEENLDYLKGNLVWRVHVRKGLHQRNQNGEQKLVGVTTLLEVYFHSDQIKSAT